MLRQANSHRIEGSIEFQIEAPVTVYFDSGKPYAVEAGINLTESHLASLPVEDELVVRAQLVDELAAVLSARSGWYFHDPLGQHPSRGAWTWETATLLMDVRSRAHETSSMAAWTDRAVTLRAVPDGTVALGPEAWAVVVELAGSAATSDLRARLGWQPERLAAALADLEACGALDPDPPATARPQPAAALRLPPPPDAVPGGTHTGPLTPPPRAALLHRRPSTSRRSGR